VRHPSLDDVFFALTGGHIDDGDGDDSPRQAASGHGVREVRA
jgi:hypothetical protein